MRYKVGQSWFRLVLNCQIFPKKELLGKFKCKIYVPIYTPIMLLKISQISLEWVMNYKVIYIQGNLIQIDPIVRFFSGKISVTFAYLLPILSYRNTQNFKIIIRVNIDINGWKNVGQCGFKLPICP